jgi:hypothetical protein
MGPEDSNTDEDLFALGTLNPGNVLELDLRLPSTSTLAPRLRVLNAAGNPVTDEDGNPNDDHFRATLTSSGAYYAEVASYWVHDGQRYLLINPRTWNDAETYAQSLGGHLVTINDAAEQAWLDQTFNFIFWTGLNDTVTEGTWQWASGEPVSYTNWASGQPSGGTSYNAAYFNGSGDGAWYSIWNNHTSYQYLGIVELDDPQGRVSAGPGPRAQYLLDVEVSDPIPPQVVSISTLPAEGGTSSQPIGSFTVTVSEALAAATVNPPLWNFGTYNGHTYLVTSTSMTWAQAQTYAQSLGGNLVTINDAPEQEWVHRTFGAQDLWIGLNDTVTEGTWRWASGEAVTYTNWSSGYPQFGTSENAAYFDDNTGKWFSTNHNNTTFRAIDELNAATDANTNGQPDVLENLNPWTLQEAGTDQAFGTTDDQWYALYVSPTYTGGTTVSFEITNGPLGTGKYRLRIAPSVTDVVGNMLDGNGDGTGGDPFTRNFFVQFQLPDGFVFEGRNNHNRASAVPLTLAENPAASGLFLTQMFGVGTIDPGTDSDWWSFTAEAGDLVSVSVDTPGSDLAPTVYL